MRRAVRPPWRTGASTPRTLPRRRDRPERAEVVRLRLALATVSLVAEDLVPDSATVVADLHRARRKNRLANVDWFDAFYKTYVSAGATALATYAASGAVGDLPLRPSAVHRVQVDGPLWIGLLFAVIVAVGLRSGGRGGPLAFERADVRHVLLAPVDRRVSLRLPALRGLRHAAFVGAAVGAASGIVAPRRLPELPAGWIACGTLAGALVGAAAYGAGLVLSGLRVRRWIADVLALVLVAWSVVDVALSLRTSPMSFLGSVPLWPLGFDIGGAIATIVVVLLVVGGWAAIPGASMEAAERRSRLVGQLRFAATLQDVRTVMVIQRQLAQEHLRERPRVRLPRMRGSGVDRRGELRRTVVLRRGLHGYLRWPATRVARVVLLSLGAGAAMCGAWLGTTPLVIAAGLLLWLVALDLMEALAQDADHPDRLLGVARQRGTIMIKHLVLPFVGLVALCALAAVPAVVWGDRHIVAALWPLGVLASWCALGGAAVMVDRPVGAPTTGIETPEVASMKFAWRVLMPPGLAVLGCAPLIPARNAWLELHSTTQMAASMNLWFSGALACGSWAVAWIRWGDQFREQFTTMGANAVGGGQKGATAAKGRPSTTSTSTEKGPRG